MATAGRVWPHSLPRVDAADPAAALTISLLPTNDGARRLYAGLGFVETGDVHHGEIVMRRAAAMPR